MMEEWHKRLALRIVADLPESEEDARLVLQAAGSLLGYVFQEEPMGAPENRVVSLVRPQPTEPGVA